MPLLILGYRKHIEHAELQRMNSPATIYPKGRLDALDSIRGIAAFVVVLFHCYLTWPTEQYGQLNWIRYTPLRLLISGHASVITFFVLSGYVLALPFFRGTQPNYAHYLMKRFCRIYIPFAVSIGFALLLYAVVGNKPVTGMSEWFATRWPASWPDISVLTGHLLMTGTRETMSLNVPMWSLVFEMRISIIFPLLVLLCRDTRIAIVSGILIFFGSVAILYATGNANQYMVDTEKFWVTIFYTIRIIPCFLLGIVLSKHAPQIHQWLQGKPAWWALLLPGIAVVTFLMPASWPFDLVYSAGAGIMIVSALEFPKIKNLLEGRVALWLGHISYSLYLVHVPILLALFHFLSGMVPFPVIVLMVIGLSLAAASLMHVLVEIPAIRLGRKLAAG